MPAPGLPGCTYQTPGEIHRQWPDLKYLPRPEPSSEFVEDYRHWSEEYRHWRDLRCGTGYGYFCRSHGMWITCEEVRSGIADRSNQTPYSCPGSHYELQSLLSAFFARQAKNQEDVAAALKAKLLPEEELLHFQHEEQGEEVSSSFDRLTVDPDGGQEPTSSSIYDDDSSQFHFDSEPPNRWGDLQDSVDMDYGQRNPRAGGENIEPYKFYPQQAHPQTYGRSEKTSAKQHDSSKKGHTEESHSRHKHSKSEKASSKSYESSKTKKSSRKSKNDPPPPASSSSSSYPPATYPEDENVGNDQYELNEELPQSGNYSGGGQDWDYDDNSYYWSSSKQGRSSHHR